MTSQSSYSTNEEIANTLTHALGAILSVVACYLLLNNAIADSNNLKTISYAIYGTSLLLLFTASTVYHAVQNSEKKKLFKLLDHCAIYLLIAGTYTPLMMITLDNQLGMIMLSIIWTLAILGIFYLNNQQYIVKISFFKKTILLNNKLIIALDIKNIK